MAPKRLLPHTICVVLLLTTIHTLTVTPDLVLNANNNDVKRWASQISSGFVDLKANALNLQRAQTVFDNAPYEQPGLDLEKMAEEMADSLSDVLEITRNQVEDLVAEVEKLWEKNEADGPQGNYFNMTDPDKGDLDYDERFYQDVDLEQSSVRVPSKTWNDGTDEAIALSAELDDLFIANLDEYPTTKWQYFGHTTGMFRIYPAHESGKNKKGSYDDYDPRLRSWYVGASSGPKDVVLLLDISGSMTDSIDGDSRLNVAKEAAVAVLDTLTVEDFVNVVVFNDEAYVDPCFPDSLVQAAPDNVAHFKWYINGLVASGETNFVDAFELAFDLLDETKKKGQSSGCVSTILFLTDGKADDPSDVIAGRNADLGTVIFSYSLGADADDKIPRRIACENRGIWTPIENGDDLLFAMGSYYAYFAAGITTSDVFVTSPYYDASGLGVVVTVSAPAYNRRVTPALLVGVVGVDVQLADLLAATAFQSGLSYSFITTTNGIALAHPRLPLPTNWKESSSYVDISVLETADGFDAVRTDLMKRKSGETTLEATLELTRGNAAYDGTQAITTDVTYVYEAVSGVPWSFCLAIAEEDLDPRILTDTVTAASHFPNVYHRIDLLSAAQTQAETLPLSDSTYPGATLTFNHSTFKVPPRGFTDPVDYVASIETISDAEAVYNLNNPSSGGPLDNICPVSSNGGGVMPSNSGLRVQQHIRGEVLASSALACDWIDAYRSERYSDIVWVYFGSKSGLFRIYPGGVSEATYDPTVRPWFHRGWTFRSKVATSTPYKDASGAGKVVTLSTAVYEGVWNGEHNSVTDPIEGVLGLDFQYDGFVNVVDNYTEFECSWTICLSSSCCVMLDSSGYLITHSSFAAADADDEDEYENVFVGTKFGFLANALISDGVLVKSEYTDYANNSVNDVYAVDDSLFDTDGLVTGSFGPTGTRQYKIGRVETSNTYLVYQTRESGDFATEPNFVPNRVPIEIDVCDAKILDREGASCPSFSLTDEDIDNLRPEGSSCSLNNLALILGIIGGVMGLVVVGLVGYYCYQHRTVNGGDGGGGDSSDDSPPKRSRGGRESRGGSRATTIHMQSIPSGGSTRSDEPWGAPPAYPGEPPPHFY